MTMSLLSKVLRAGEGKKVRRLEEIVPLINALEPDIEALSDEQLAAKTMEFRDRLAEGETLDDLLVEAFAVVREGAWRVLGQRRPCHRFALDRSRGAEPRRLLRLGATRWG